MDRILDVVGRAMIAAGLLLLSFVGYQLWGTGVAESRAQSELQTQFRSQAPSVPDYGDVVGRLRIASIDVDKFIVAGTSYESLERGPGLFVGSPLPGQLGNVAIAGHRTTYGAPFARIDEIRGGDEIVIETKKGTYRYVVEGAPRIVEATDVKVVRTTDKNRAIVTLLSCHPKWTSKKRIIVVGALSSSAAPEPATTFVPASSTAADQETLTAGWFHDPSAWPGVIALATLLTVVATAGVVVGRRSGRRPASWAVATMLFLPLLWLFFGQITRLLPSNI